MSMIECLDKVATSREDFRDIGAISKAILLCDVLKEADIRRATPYIAYKYGMEFNTAWKDNPELINRFYKTHMPELYAYTAYKLNAILDYLLESIPTLVKQPTIKVDQAVVDSLDRLTDELTRSTGVAIELENSLCTDIDDLIAGKSCIRRPILQEFELLKQITNCNVEINKDIRIYKNGLRRYNTYAFSSRLADICLDIMKKIRYRQGICPSYANWGTLLGALYRLHVPTDWLYENGYGKLYGYCDEYKVPAVVPYCNMELEEVLVGPKEYVKVAYDEKLYKLMQCKRTANRPDNELVTRYVCTFYRPGVLDKEPIDPPSIV